jgi:hypothetical protein
MALKDDGDGLNIVDQVLISWKKRKRKTKPYGLKAKVFVLPVKTQ